MRNALTPKTLRQLGLILAGCFLLLTNAWAVPGGKIFAEGKKQYDAGQYQAAIAIFEQAISENSAVYASKGNYMIALCHKKLDRCSQAAAFFRKALTADPATGGASSAAKFDEQVKACNLSRAALAAAEEPPPSAPPQVQPAPAVAKEEEKKRFSPVILLALSSVAIALLAAFMVRRRKQRQQVEQTNAEGDAYLKEQLFNIQEILFNDALWSDYAQRFGEDAVSRVRTSWQLEYSQLVTSGSAVGTNDLLRQIRQLELSPASVFSHPGQL